METLGKTNADKTQANAAHSAYVLRIAAGSDFKYESGIKKLLSLNLNSHTPQTMRFTTAADDHLDETRSAGGNHARSRMMDLSTQINLDSTLAVSSLFRCCLLADRR